MLLNCGTGEDSYESLGLHETKPVNPKGNPPWIFIRRTGAEAEAPSFGHLMQRADLLEKTLMLGKIEGRRRGGQRMRQLDGITDSVDRSLSSGSWWWTGKPGMLQSMGLQRARLSDWTELKDISFVVVVCFFFFFLSSGAWIQTPLLSIIYWCYGMRILHGTVSKTEFKLLFWGPIGSDFSCSLLYKWSLPPQHFYTK